MTVAQSLISFVLAAGLLVVTPGLDTALVLRAIATGGPSRAAAAVLGVLLGTLVWGGIVAVGLGALLAASETAYGVLKWIGVAYLVWCGVRLILRPHSRSLVPADPAPLIAEDASGWFWKGLLQNLLNPKMGVFYMSFLPQFVPAEVSPAPYTFLLSVIHDVLGAAWFGVLVLATRPIVEALRRPNVLRAMDRVTGAVFVGFGVKLALSRR